MNHEYCDENIYEAFLAVIYEFMNLLSPLILLMQFGCSLWSFTHIIKTNKPNKNSKHLF